MQSTESAGTQLHVAITGAHGLIGSALSARLAAFEAIGVDTLLAVPCGGDRPAVVRALAEATG